MGASTRQLDRTDAGAAVRAAQDAIDRAIQVGGLTGDPLQHVLQAQSAMLGAMHQLHVDSSRTLAQQLAEAAAATQDVERITKAHAEALRPALGNEMREAGYDIAQRCAVRLDRRSAMRFAGCIFAAMLFGCVVGAFIDNYFTSGVTWHVPAACGTDSGGKTWCQPGVWLGDIRPPR